MNLLLLGNYGTGNLGDEALKDYFLERYPEVQWQVISACPEDGQLPRLPLGLRSLFRPWWQTLRAAKRSDGVVLGGGTLFTDAESIYACFLWWWHVFAFRLLRVPVYATFQGIGPFHSFFARWLTRRSLLKVSYLSVRDELSYERCTAMNLNKNIVQTCDPVFSLFKKENEELRTKNVLIIIPRHNSGEAFINAVKRHRDERVNEVRIVSMQPDNAAERSICEQIQALFSPQQVPIIGVLSLLELQKAIADASVVITERYHGALATLALGVELKIVTQVPGDKLSSLQNVDLETMAELLESGEKSLRAIWS